MTYVWKVLLYTTQLDHFFSFYVQQTNLCRCMCPQCVWVMDKFCWLWMLVDVELWSLCTDDVAFVHWWCCCCQTLDGDYYEKVRDFLTLLARTEQSSANTANECFQRVMDDASKVRVFQWPCLIDILYQTVLCKLWSLACESIIIPFKVWLKTYHNKNAIVRNYFHLSLQWFYGYILIAQFLINYLILSKY